MTFVFVAIALLGAPPLAAQGRIQSPLIEREQVRFVTLEVVVEERRGRGWRPLRGLEQGDLRVLVDGQEMVLEQFEDHCAVGETAGRAPVPSPVPQAAQPASGALTTRYILYVDLSWIDQRGLSAFARATRTWAAGIDPAAQVMIVLAGENLRIVRPFRPASEGLQADLEHAEREAMRAYLFSAWDAARASEAEGQASIRYGMIGPSPAESAGGIEAEFRTQQTWSRMDLLMTLLTGIEGTKNLVLFAQNLALYEGQTGMIRELANAANERDVRVYAVDTAGRAVSSALTFLTTETGGRYLENTNRVDGIFDLIAGDLGCFYRVGFRLPELRSGTSERTRVQLPGHPRARVRYRATVEQPTPEEEAHDRLLAAMTLPESATALPISVTATALTAGTGARTRIELRVPLASFLNLPEDGGAWRRVALQAGATLVPIVDSWEDGGLPVPGGGWAAGKPWSFADGAVLRLPSGRDEAAEPESVLVAREVRVPPGTYRVIAVAQDTASGEVGAGTGEFVVAEDPSVLGAIRLAASDPRSVPLPRGPDASEEGKRERFAMLDSSFPDDGVALPAPALEAGSGGWAVYAVCQVDRSPQDAPFAGWSLRHGLDCGEGETPPTLQPRPLPPPAAGEACVLLVDPLPTASLIPGRCRFRVELERPGEAAATAMRTFIVRPRAPSP